MEARACLQWRLPSLAVEVAVQPAAVQGLELELELVAMVVLVQEVALTGAAQLQVSLPTAALLLSQSPPRYPQRPSLFER